MQLQQVRHVPGLMPAPQPCCHLQDPLGSRAPTPPPHREVLVACLAWACTAYPKAPSPGCRRAAGPRAATVGLSHSAQGRGRGGWLGDGTEKA